MLVDELVPQWTDAIQLQAYLIGIWQILKFHFVFDEFGAFDRMIFSR